MTFIRPSSPMAVMAAVCLATGLGQPAKALGGGVVVSQATPGSGDTVVAVSGNIVNPGTGYGYTAGQSVNFNFTVANSFVGGTSSWNGGVDPYYFFDSVDYTALSGNTFTGTFNAANTTAGSLEIYKSGLVRFDILATSPPLYRACAEWGRRANSPQQVQRSIQCGQQLRCCAGLIAWFDSNDCIFALRCDRKLSGFKR